MVWMWTVVVLLLNTVELTSRDNMPAEPKMYKIQEGDTLSDLFGQNWQEVAAFNGIEDPTKLQIGQEINVNLYEPPVKQTPAPQEMNTSVSGEQGFLKGAADWATGYFEDFTAGAEAFGDDVYSTFVNSPMPQTLEELGSPEELAAMEDIGAPEEAPEEAPVDNKTLTRGLLEQKGYSPIAIAGIMGNIDVETGGTFNYQEKQRGGAGYGVFQYDFMKPYYNAYLEKAGVEDSLESQIEFMDETINGSEQDIIGKGNAKKLREGLAGAETPEESARIFMEVFEKPGVPHLERRKKAAASYL